MKKPTINKLKYPVWYNVVYYTLTLIVPIIFILVEGFNSPSTVFRCTFSVISALLILWTFVRKFLLSKIELKLQSRKASLEHDYEIEVGNSTKIKWLWYTNELWIAVINMIQVVLIGGFIVLLAVGIQNAAITVKGVAFLIAILYTVAYTVKFTYILASRDKNEDDTSEVTDEQSTTK